MFDIGFLEIVTIFVIAILVIGPERMPEVARSIGRTLAKIRRFVENTKREMDLDTQGELKELMDLKNQLRGEIDEVRAIGQDLERDVNQFDEELRRDTQMQKEAFEEAYPNYFDEGDETSISKGKDPYDTFRKAGLDPSNLEVDTRDQAEAETQTATDKLQTIGIQGQKAPEKVS